MPLLERLPEYLGAHLLLSVTALSVGCAISIPVGIAVARSPRFGGPMIAAAGLAQTIPAIALLALMVPLLGGQIGFLPAFIALTVYSLLPVLRNTAIAIAEIDPQITEAARSVGMTPGQRLRLVELPIALPVIVGGIRTAVVWVIGTATLATPVGATSLGNYIFAGLQTRNWLSVILGCIAAAGLAIILDQLVRLLESGLRQRRPALARGAGLGLLSVIALGLAPVLIDAVPTPERAAFTRSGDDSESGGEAVAELPQPLAGVRLVVGGKTYTEQYILTALLEDWLEERGAVVESRTNLGSSILFDALAEGSVDIAVDFSGTLWANIFKRTEPVPRFRMLARVTQDLLDDYGVLSLGSLGYENNYAVALKPALARSRGLTDLRDLQREVGRLTLTSDLEFQGRTEFTRLVDIYGLEGIDARAMDQALAYQALEEGSVDAIVAYTTDGRLDAFELTLLPDVLGAFPPYDAMLLLSPDSADIPGLAQALAPLIGAIDEKLMRAANAIVDVEGRPVEAAADFLREQIEARRRIRSE